MQHTTQTAERTEYEELPVRVAELREDDQILIGGEIAATVHNTTPYDTGALTVISLDFGALRLLPDTQLMARRPAAVGNQDEGQEEPEIRLTVELEVSESVEYTFTSEVTVPASTVDAEDELASYLYEEQDGWLDDLDPLQGDVLERDIRSVRILHRYDA